MNETETIKYCHAFGKFVVFLREKNKNKKFNGQKVNKSILWI